MNFTDKKELENLVIYSKPNRQKTFINVSENSEEFSSKDSSSFFSHNKNDDSINNSIDAKLELERQFDCSINFNLSGSETIDDLLTDIKMVEEKLGLEAKLLSAKGKSKKKDHNHNILVFSTNDIEIKRKNVKRRNTAVYDFEEIKEKSPSKSNESHEELSKIDEKIEQFKDVVLEEKEENNLKNLDPLEQCEHRERRSSSMARASSLSVIFDVNKKDFKRQSNSLLISKMESKLTKGMSNKMDGLNKNIRNTKSIFNNNSKSKNIAIYFFSSPIKLVVPIPISCTVKESIRIIMDFYMANESSNQELLKYSLEPEAYELRFLEDDDDYRPEMSFDALDLNRKLSEYNIDSLSFCEIPNYKSILNLNFLMSKPNKMQDLYNFVLYYLDNFPLRKDKTKEMEEILKKKKMNPISVKIENYQSIIGMEDDKLVKDIFPILQKKYKINPKKYVVRLPMYDDSDYDIATNFEEIDINMPLKQLKQNKLLFVKKTFADDPEPSTELKDESYSIARKSFVNEAIVVKPDSIIFNEVTASKYEEFEVIKINSRGKKQGRILGIDQFKIYNKLKDRDSGITNIFNIFSASYSTKNPERQIETLQEVNLIRETFTENLFHFYIDADEPNNKIKRLIFEIRSKNDCERIISKLDFLIKKNKEKRRKEFVRTNNLENK